VVTYLSRTYATRRTASITRLLPSGARKPLRGYNALRRESILTRVVARPDHHRVGRLAERVKYRKPTVLVRCRMGLVKGVG